LPADATAFRKIDETAIVGVMAGDFRLD